MRFLYVEDDDNVRQLFTMHLENCVGEVEVVECISGNDAIDLLKKDRNFHLIISDYDMMNGNGGDLYKYVEETKINIPFTLFSTKEPQHLDEFKNFKTNNPLNDNITKPIRGSEFKEFILGKVKNFGFQVKDTIHEKYQKVRLIHFYRYNKVLCDVYLKLSEKKYVKVINQNDVYTREDIQKYLKKKQKYLYILEKDYEGFATSFAKTPFLIEANDIPKEKLGSVITSTIEIIQDMVTDVGISKQVLNLVEKTVEKIDEDVKKHKDISHLINRLKNRKDYLADHSYLTAHIATAMGMELDWITPEMTKKLNVAAILHDATLDNPDMALEFDLGIFDESKYTKKEIADFYAHPKAIMFIVKKSDRLPHNLEEIVYHHHEGPEPSPLSKNVPPEQLSKLSAVFNVAHFFVCQMYRYGLDDSDYKRIILFMKEHFKNKAYQAPMSALVRSLKKVEGILEIA